MSGDDDDNDDDDDDDVWRSLGNIFSISFILALLHVRWRMNFRSINAYVLFC